MLYQPQFSKEPFSFETDFAQQLVELKPNREVNRQSQEYIRWVQTSLNKILRLRLATDGIMGLQTRSAIRSFQSHNNLVPDGVVGTRTEGALISAGARPFLDGRSTAHTSIYPLAVPALLKPKEGIPPAYTLYVDIPLQIPLGNAKSMTGIFIPENYQLSTKVDFIVYLPGHKSWEDWNPIKPNLSVDSYWRLPPFPLREGVNQSRKNVILAIPTLGPKSQAGRLIHPGGFDNFLDQVLAALKQYGPFARLQNSPMIGNLILAGHSGGGLPMRQIALGNDRYVAKIRECWGFDSTYFGGDDTGWAQWVRLRPHAKAYFYYIPKQPTERLALRLKSQNLPNLSVQESTPRGGHNFVPIAHWRDRIQGAQFLANN